MAERWVLVVAVALVLLAAPSAAWWDKGHMTVAEVARRHMTADVLAKAEAAAAVLSRKGPYPLNSDFTQSAPWPDDIGAAGLKTMASWHYIQAPYIPAEEADTFHLEMSPVAEVSVLTVIPLLASAIANEKARADTIAQSVVNLLHYVGDSHQPLHSTNLFSSKYPTGDLAGNLMTVVWDNATGVTMNLHAFWDSMGRGPTDTDDIPRPLTASGYKVLSDLADYLEANYGSNLTDAEKAETNATVFVEESYDLARSFTYAGVGDGTVLTEAYKAKARTICDRRVLLAGYRLAALLNKALKDVPLSRITAGENNVAALANAAATTTAGGSSDATAREVVLRDGGLTGGQAAGLGVGLFLAGVLVSCLVVALAFSLVGDGRDRRPSSTVPSGPPSVVRKYRDADADCGPNASAKLEA